MTKSFTAQEQLQREALGEFSPMGDRYGGFHSHGGSHYPDRLYPLVNIQKTMENHNFLWVNQHKSTISMAVASIADCNKFPEGNGKIQKNG